MPITLVTGAATRIGQAIALTLAADGHDIVVHYNRAPANGTLAAVTELGQQAWLVQADLATPDGADALFDEACAQAGTKLDYVVNNASQFLRGSLHEVQLDHLETMMRLHAWSPLVLARRLAKNGGTAVVNITDTRVDSHDPDHVAYHLSKQALARMTRTLARELAPVRVNAVAPGPILAPTDGSPDAKADMARAVDATLMGRAGTPQEVASAVCYLLKADYVTGETLHVDGGRHVANNSP